MGFKIGGLSLPKISPINQMAELAIKASLPLNNALISTKLADSLLHSVLLKSSLGRKLAALENQLPISTFLDIEKN